MKISKLFISAVLVLFSLSACADDKVVAFNTAPQAVQSFVKKHFPKSQVTRTVKDYDNLSYNWEVYLSEGYELEFTKKGDWKKVDGHRMALPKSVILLMPKQISDYCSQNFPEAQIVEMDKDRRDYQIQLSNGVELEFDLQGNFIRFDD